MLQGKSVGFVRLKSHAPSSHEIAANPDLAQVSRIIDEWLLIENACTFLPMNQSALVEAVIKSAVKPAILSALGIESPSGACGFAAVPVVAFTPEEVIRRAIERRIAAFDFEALANSAIADSLDRARPSLKSGAPPVKPAKLETNRPLSWPNTPLMAGGHVKALKTTPRLFAIAWFSM
jgi:hypothetical protein